MADPTLIPPVGISQPLPKPRSVPSDKQQSKRPPKPPVPKKPNKDDDRPGIDEYA